MTGLAWRFAVRELRHGVAGFRIFFACLVLGVAAIAAVNSVADAFRTGLAVKGRELLGGDVEFRLTQRAANDAERTWLNGQGQVSATAELRGMVRAEASGERTLVELKAVDQAYPLYGAVALEGGGDFRPLLALREGVYGALVEAVLLDKLKLKAGDPVVIGAQRFVVRGVLAQEPDRVAGGFSLGPRVLVSQEALTATGLIQPGSLISFNYRLALPGTERDAQGMRAFIERANAQFPQAGWQPRDRWNAAGGVRRFINQVNAFLTLVGLTALVVGGVGVGNAVRGYVERRRADIATLKCVGATGGFIMTMFLFEVMIMAVLAAIVGVALGAALPFGLVWLFGDDLPVPAAFGLYPWALGQAAVFGLMIALLFALWPLARTRDISPASLFRDVVSPSGQGPRWGMRALIGGLALVTMGLALWASGQWQLGLGFAGAVTGSFLVLWALAGLVRWIAARTRPRRPALRLAVANLHRPGAPTGAIMLSLGLGLSLIAAIALIDRNLRMAINEQLPERAPSLIFIDVPSGDVAAFDALVKGFKSAAAYERYPMLRGRIVKLKGVPAAQAQVDPSVRWALNGDRGISYGDPAGAKAQVVAGTWWAPGDVGQRKVSFDENLAQGMGLTVGDTVTVNVLGRDLELTIASLRRVDYANARLNFSLIVAPGLLEGAPHMHLASVRVAPDEERAVEQSVSARYPSISIVRVREAIETANGLLAQLADALRAASLITLVTGFLVLWGSIAAGQRQRLYDAVVMKVLGASRARILWVSILEFALIGLAAAIVACLAGGLAAWAVITFVMQGTFILSPDVLALVVLTGLTATLGLGLMATWSTLSVKPARQLRTL